MSSHNITYCYACFARILQECCAIYYHNAYVVSNYLPLSYNGLYE